MDNDTWILKDWADNRLTDRKGKTLEFKTFEDGWEYIYGNYEEDEFEELFIVTEEQ